MALTITEGFTWGNGNTVMPTRLNKAVRELTIQMAASKLLGTTGAGNAVEIGYTAAGLSLLQAADVAAARTALSLGDSATKNVGAIAGTVCAGDDARLTDSRKCNNAFDDVTAARTALGIFASVLSDTKAATTHTGVAGADLVYTAGPQLTLTAGTWLVIGGCPARTNDAGDSIWLRFRNATDGTDFGAGAAVDTGPDLAIRHPLLCTGVVTVAANKLIYLKAFRVGATTLDLGTANAGANAGHLLALRLY